ncbi:hypothetical protein [Bacillus sp. V59.32b]|uniref:hypothetical protein n=1 Tax=Bacillus sp. V59.32b TaxID=1758642 RepID=UPI0015772199|nr:hypothetical protein [Bacillus sp. V59.32b]
MKAIAIILIVLGAIGLLISTMMFGDIGIASAIGSITAILSGTGLLLVNKELKDLKK